MLGCDVNDIAGYALDRKPRDVQRLGINETVNRAPKKLPKFGLVHIAGIENSLAQVLSRSGVIIVLSENRNLGVASSLAAAIRVTCFFIFLSRPSQQNLGIKNAPSDEPVIPFRC